MSAAEMREAAEAILRDWEAQAEEMDMRNPMRAQILSEAALLRKCIAPLPDEEGMVETVAEEPDILRAAVEEYLLRHPSEGPDERISRAAAVRGMMVRLGLYSEFERAVDYAVFQSPAIRDINGGKP